MGSHAYWCMCTRGARQNMKTIKTYLIEDSAVIRESLIATLEELSDVRVIGTAEDESSATRWLLALGLILRID